MVRIMLIHLLQDFQVYLQVPNIIIALQEKGKKINRGNNWSSTGSTQMYDVNLFWIWGKASKIEYWLLICRLSNRHDTTPNDRWHNTTTKFLWLNGYSSNVGLILGCGFFSSQKIFYIFCVLSCCVVSFTRDMCSVVSNWYNTFGQSINRPVFRLNWSCLWTIVRNLQVSDSSHMRIWENVVIKSDLWISEGILRRFLDYRIRSNANPLLNRVPRICEKSCFCGFSWIQPHFLRVILNWTPPKNSF